MSKETRVFINKIKNINQQLNEGRVDEVSPETFKSAINQSNKRGSHNRTNALGSLFLNKFIGSRLLNGKISNY